MHFLWFCDKLQLLVIRILRHLMRWYSIFCDTVLCSPMPGCLHQCPHVLSAFFLKESIHCLLLLSCRSHICCTRLLLGKMVEESRWEHMQGFIVHLLRHFVLVWNLFYKECSWILFHTVYIFFYFFVFLILSIVFFTCLGFFMYIPKCFALGMFVLTWLSSPFDLCCVCVCCFFFLLFFFYTYIV